MAVACFFIGRRLHAVQLHRLLPRLRFGFRVRAHARARDDNFVQIEEIGL